MASARKTYTRGKPQHAALPLEESFEKACFMSDLLDGTIQATGLSEIRAGNGNLIRLEYDDPQGVGAGAAARAKENGLK